MGLILLLESSTEVCSVALTKNGSLLDFEENQEGLSHSELLTSYVETILKRNNLKAKDIDAFGVSKGPGSYTGLRIGVSAAKGLCYASNKPLIAVSTFDAMVWYILQNPQEFNLNLKGNILLCPMIDARRMEVYFAIYNTNLECLKPVSAKIITENSFNELFENNKIVFFGNGAEKCTVVIKHPNALFIGPQKVSARFMAGLAEQKYNEKKFEDIAYFEPYYLKDFVATIPKNKVF
jgi:tRNA threonylcarbamoyladenosine biosynthesis protein TsaB